jgi:hypothetical protein
MREQNLSKERISEIKQKLNFKNVNDLTFDIDDFVKSFNDKNIYFLELYKHLRDENRYLNFLNSLNTHGRLSSFFPRFNDVSSVYNDYKNRRIYHSSIFCKWITNDYVDETRTELNTGIYANDFLQKKASYYKIDEDYLQELHLKECNICENILMRSSSRFLLLFEILSRINVSNKISISYEIIIENEYVLQLLLKKAKYVTVEILIHENQWKTIKLDNLLESNFVLRLVHNQFTFFNKQLMLILNDDLYFYQEGTFCIPDINYINITAFHLLDFNTIVLSKNDELTIQRSYFVPVTYCFSSNDEVFGEQTIVQLEVHGLKTLITLKCHPNEVPDTILGYWKTKAEVFSSDYEGVHHNHNFFDFKCTDERVLHFIY